MSSSFWSFIHTLLYNYSFNSKQSGIVLFLCCHKQLRIYTVTRRAGNFARRRYCQLQLMHDDEIPFSHKSFNCFISMSSSFWSYTHCYSIKVCKQPVISSLLPEGTLEYTVTRRAGIFARRRYC